jgi:hypothetical protein
MAQKNKANEARTKAIRNVTKLKLLEIIERKTKENLELKKNQQEEIKLLADALTKEGRTNQSLKSRVLELEAEVKSEKAKQDDLEIDKMELRERIRHMRDVMLNQF